MKLQWIDHAGPIQSIFGELLEPMGVPAWVIDSGEFVVYGDDIIYFPTRKPYVVIRFPKDAVTWSEKYPTRIKEVDLAKVEVIKPAVVSTRYDLFLGFDGLVLRYIRKGHGKYTTHLLTDEVFIIPKEKIVPNKSGKGYATDALGFWARVTGDEKEIEATLNGPFRYAKVSLVVRNGKIVYKFVGPEE